MVYLRQAVLKSFGLIEEIDEQADETISGDYEVSEVKNKTVYNIPYTVDGKTTGDPAPGSDRIWTAYSGGIIEFDADGRDGYELYKKSDLADGGVYEFQDNTTTIGNPYDIELYRVA
ncbi:hypothetical protein [Nostoc sp.]|uniref:hypothetical protein n=1 Tax=Nostoc sp. TaxID=1180 RepID=UPI002FFBAEE2